MALPELSAGILMKIKQGLKPPEPIVQVLSSKLIDDQTSNRKRYRLLVSDSIYSNALTMFAGPEAQRAPGDISKFSIIKLKKYVTSEVSAAAMKSTDRNILVILELEMVKEGKEIGVQIGNPVHLTREMAAADKENSISSSNAPHAKRCVSWKQPKGPVSMNPDSDPVVKISKLSPYEAKWVIKARVTNKSQIRTWATSQGEGKLFFFDVVDQSGEIRITAFQDVVDKYFDFVQINKIYYISKCLVKMADRQFSSVRHNYELTIGHESIVTECLDDDAQIPTVRYNFVSIDDIPEIKANSIIDVIGVCTYAEKCERLQAKSTLRQVMKRDIILMDQSRAEVKLCLWALEAERFNDVGQVIAVKGVRVLESISGKGVCTMSGSVYKVNPNVQEAVALRAWYESGGGGGEEGVLDVSERTGAVNTPWMTFKEVQDQKLGASEHGDYFQLYGTITQMRHDNLVYKACPTVGCHRKVVSLEHGKYRCEKCDLELNGFQYRLIGHANVADTTGCQWITLFNEDCEQLLGASAQEVGEKSKADRNYLPDLIREEVNFNDYHFTCRVKSETFNGESRLRTIAIQVIPVDYQAYNARLITEIEKFQA